MMIDVIENNKENFYNKFNNISNEIQEKKCQEIF